MREALYLQVAEKLESYADALAERAADSGAGAVADGEALWAFMAALKRDSATAGKAAEAKALGAGVFETLGTSLERIDRPRDARTVLDHAQAIGSKTAAGRLAELFLVHAPADLVSRTKYYEAGVAVNDPKAMVRFATDSQVTLADERRTSLMATARPKLEAVAAQDDEAKWLLTEILWATNPHEVNGEGIFLNAQDPIIRTAVRQLEQVKNKVTRAHWRLVQILGFFPPGTPEKAQQSAILADPALRASVFAWERTKRDAAVKNGQSPLVAP